MPQRTKLRTAAPKNTVIIRIWINPFPRGGFEAFAFPHVPKVTHSAPWPPRCWPKVLPGCITSNFATIPVRPSAASRRSVPGYGAPESARSKSTAASPPQATNSTSASRAFHPALHPDRIPLRHADRSGGRRTAAAPLVPDDDPHAPGTGVRVHDRNDHLPLHIQGPIRGGEVQVEGLVSSQFITGLLLALPIAEEETTIHVPHVISTPYIDITIDTAERFGIEILHKDYKEFYVAGGQRYRPAEFEIESDWSAAAFLLVAGAVAGEVTIRNLSVLSRQADTAVMTASYGPAHPSSTRATRSPSHTVRCKPSHSTRPNVRGFSRPWLPWPLQPKERASSREPPGWRTRRATAPSRSARSTPNSASRSISTKRIR